MFSYQILLQSKGGFGLDPQGGSVVFPAGSSMLFSDAVMGSVLLLQMMIKIFNCVVKTAHIASICYMFREVLNPKPNNMHQSIVAHDQ